ncbi:MAG: nitroreductase family protein [Tissierellales bacterium]|jgi:FMN reductase (NADPH)|nr:nitroreductase family protein [Tissierellales bacterium]MBN2827411.1 nitroreductase family protein [Tissierellales bacterium]
MNQVIKTLKERVSLRRYDDREISKEDLDTILDCAMKAPTAGNMMLYSIIVVKNPETKMALSKSCDDQPFIAKAPVLLVFVADQQKWFNYFIQSNVSEYTQKNGPKFEAPQESDLLLACEDAMISAQNAVIAAESLGIGSCYIGDILEHYEYHQELLGLPDWAFPITMLTLGYYEEGHNKVFRQRFDKKYIVFEEKYKNLSKQELDEMLAERSQFFVYPNAYGAENYGQQFYAQKSGAEFSKEMARSVRVALKKWSGRLL